jgi:hypothetical protein
MTAVTKQEETWSAKCRIGALDRCASLTIFTTGGYLHRRAPNASQIPPFH